MLTVIEVIVQKLTVIIVIIIIIVSLYWSPNNLKNTFKSTISFHFTIPFEEGKAIVTSLTTIMSAASFQLHHGARGICRTTIMYSLHCVLQKCDSGCNGSSRNQGISLSCKSNGEQEAPIWANRKVFSPQSTKVMKV